jgi:hypothetical protein
MNKVYEYLAVSAVAIAVFLALVNLSFSSAQADIIKDCEASGHSRQGKVLLKCEVVK